MNSMRAQQMAYWAENQHAKRQSPHRYTLCGLACIQSQGKTTVCKASTGVHLSFKINWCGPRHNWGMQKRWKHRNFSSSILFSWLPGVDVKQTVSSLEFLKQQASFFVFLKSSKNQLPHHLNTPPQIRICHIQLNHRETLKTWRNLHFPQPGALVGFLYSSES